MSATTPEPLLTVRDLGAPPFGTSAPLWSGVSFDLVPGEILCLVRPLLPLSSLNCLLTPNPLLQRGPSGSGKSVLLKSLAYLLPNTTGTVLLHSQSAPTLGVPLWRSRVLYLPQRPALLPGSPSEFFDTLRGFKCRKGNETGDPREIAREWGIGDELWQRGWGELSGGEAQRIALSIGLALRPEVLLLDGAFAFAFSIWPPLPLSWSLFLLVVVYLIAGRDGKKRGKGSQLTAFCFGLAQNRLRHSTRDRRRWLRTP